MNFLNDYQTEAVTLAAYPSKYEIAYTALGLIDEVGELLRTEYGNQEAILSEMGDVCWYCAALSHDLGLKLQDCWDNPHIKMINNVEALFENSTRLCGRVKKILRGDPGKDAKVLEVQGFIGDILRRLEFLAAEHDSSLKAVMDANLDKLFDRKDRGVLKGDGDSR